MAAPLSPVESPKRVFPIVVVHPVDDAVAGTIGGQISTRLAQRITPHGVISRIDHAVGVVVARRGEVGITRNGEFPCDWMDFVQRAVLDDVQPAQTVVTQLGNRGQRFRSTPDGGGSFIVPTVVWDNTVEHAIMHDEYVAVHLCDEVHFCPPRVGWRETATGRYTCGEIGEARQVAPAIAVGIRIGVVRNRISQSGVRLAGNGPHADVPGVDDFVSDQVDVPGWPAEDVIRFDTQRNRAGIHDAIEGHIDVGWPA